MKKPDFKIAQEAYMDSETNPDERIGKVDFCKGMTGLKVKYVGKDDILALDRWKEYEVLSIEKGWCRLMTELDETYLFPPKVLEIVEN